VTPLWQDTEWADGLDGYGRRLRQGEITARAVVERALSRIAQLDATYKAFVHVASDQALSAAERIDGLIAQDTDLGPLMGVPVAIKDLFAVQDMPTTAGSRIDVSDAIGPEGSFIARLKQTGAIILGKTRTIEFAAGAQNVSHPTPWNPADREHHRSPGGSSNGSAVAVAAGYCPLAIGSDTGGSVRSPAALCGITGYKSTAGRYALDGVFPLCPAMDSVGFFTLSVRDAVLTHRALSGEGGGDTPRHTLAGCRLGIPGDDMLSGLENDVAARYREVLQRLETEAAHLVPLDWPGADEIETVAKIFAGLVPSDLIATLGLDRIAAGRDKIDPVAMHRLDQSLQMSPSDYAALAGKREELERLVAERMQGIDAVIYPTAPVRAPLISDVQSPAAAVAFTTQVLSLTRFANVYGLTACSVPACSASDGLPIGIDLAVAGGQDAAMFDLAAQLEAIACNGPEAESGF
jgi:aspartyl-tRNA(Asn)/glutamyl-tRNA(Gln) amidotransferase subunit A